MIDLLVTLAGVAGAVFLVFLLSGTETACYRASPVRLRAAAERGDARAVAVRLSLASLPRLVADLLVGYNAGVYIAAWLVTVWLERRGVGGADWWAALGLTPILFLFGDTLPKRLACDMPDRWLLAAARAMPAARRALWPAAWPMAGLAAALRRALGTKAGTGEAADSRARLMAQFAAGREAHALTPASFALSRRILRIRNLSALDAVTGMARTPVVPESAGRAEAAAALRAMGAGAALLVDARGQPTGREITLRGLWLGEPCETAGTTPCTMRDAPCGTATGSEAHSAQRKAQSAVPQSAVPRLRPETPLGDVLEIFRRTHARLALVEDDRGRAIGAVSAESLLRRLVS